jgi:hypothetical protein
MSSFRVIYGFINMQAIRVLHRRYIKHLVSQMRLIDTLWDTFFRRISRQYQSIITKQAQALLVKTI